MCEFCNKHGEGKKWYLQMRNYSQELVSAELTPVQQRFSGVRSRAEWLDRFMRSFVMVSSNPEIPEAPVSSRPGRKRPSDEAITRGAKIVHFGQIVPLKDVEEVLDQMTSITRFPCGCRIESIGKADRRYCFGLGYDPTGLMGRYPDRSASLEVIGREEAKRIFREFDQDGLIHSIWTGVTPFVIGICNCDRDCMAYRTSITNDGPATFFRAEYVAEVDAHRCTGCRSCMKQCQFGAQFFSHALGKVFIDPARCFGCGVCMAPCVKDAIRLVPRQEHPVAKEIWLKKPKT